MKKIKSYKNIKKVKKKKNSNNLKNIRVKTLIKTLRTQYKKYIKDVVNVYIRKIIKDLNNKVFKYYIYIEYYNAVLNFVRTLGLEKTVNIIFSKKPRITKEYLIQKDKKGIRTNYLQQITFRDILNLLIRRQQIE